MCACSESSLKVNSIALCEQVYCTVGREEMWSGRGNTQHRAVDNLFTGLDLQCDLLLVIQTLIQFVFGHFQPLFQNGLCHGYNHKMMKWKIISHLLNLLSY